MFDYSNVTVQKGVPIPETRFTKRHDSGLGAVLRKMSDGESIVLPLDRRGSAVSAANANKISIITRTDLTDPSKVRVWRVSETQAKLGTPTPKAATGTKSPTTKKGLTLPKLSVAKKAA